MDTRLLDKFFRLYSKCSKSYSKLCDLDNYYIISYYKSDGDLIYPYQHIDFNLLFCDKTGEKDYSKNEYKREEFSKSKHKFLANTFADDTLDGMIILNMIQKKIDEDLNLLDKGDILSLNSIYKNVINL